MKPFRFYFLPFLIGFVALSCNDNEVDLTSDFKDIPVVYALLDASEDSNWVRVNKAFLGDGNALVFAQIADSLNYPNLQVALLKINKSSNTVVDSLPLVKTINAIPKDSGLFASNSNVLYLTTSPIDKNYLYKLVLFNPDNQKRTEATTSIAGSTIFNYPNSPLVALNWEPNTNNKVVTFQWTCNSSSNIQAYQFELTFIYDEFLQSNPNTRVRKSFTNRYAIIPNTDCQQNLIRLPITKQEFYSSIANNLPLDQTKGREFIQIDISVYGAAKEFYDFLVINKPSTSVVPRATDYTNIPGGKGIFSSRSQLHMTGLKLNSITIDSLRGGQYTSELNFVN
ncbi:MAG: hypothetical protein FJZ75_05010 [Bacteroidetes bacterium]|nr:hypothetical protein [Bacteroidota bacterium]